MRTGMILWVLGVLFCAPAFGQVQKFPLKVLSFNILVSGDYHPLIKTAAVIDASGADIIGLQEAGDSPETLAKILAFHHHVIDRDLAILSRYPIVEKYHSGVRIALPNRQEAVVFNTHLTAYPYQPYDIRDGKLKNEAEAIKAAQAARGAEMAKVLEELKPHLAAKRPVILMGDFNEPSHLDWTEKAKLLHFGWKVAWPASMAVIGAGMKDAWREYRPDELADPGYTWTPFDFGPGEKHDRIDIVYFAGNGVTPTSVRILGEKGPVSDVVFDPYPSDHRAVLAALEIPAGALIGTNLIENPGAELPTNGAADAGINWVLPGWETEKVNSPITAQRWNGYSADNDGGAGTLPRPADAGRNYFHGGHDVKRQSRISQAIDLSSLKTQIDANQLNFEIAGHFGGWHNKDDHATLSAVFLNEAGQTIGGAQIGGGTIRQRAGDNSASAGPSGMKLDSAAGPLPAGTKSIRFELRMHHGGRGNSNDGCADNLSFVLKESKKP